MPFIAINSLVSSFTAEVTVLSSATKFGQARIISQNRDFRFYAPKDVSAISDSNLEKIEKSHIGVLGDTPKEAEKWLKEFMYEHRRRTMLRYQDENAALLMRAGEAKRKLEKLIVRIENRDLLAIKEVLELDI